MMGAVRQLHNPPRGFSCACASEVGGRSPLSAHYGSAVISTRRLFLSVSMRSPRDGPSVTPARPPAFIAPATHLRRSTSKAQWYIYTRGRLSARGLSQANASAGALKMDAIWKMHELRARPRMLIDPQLLSNPTFDI